MLKGAALHRRLLVRAFWGDLHDYFAARIQTEAESDRRVAGTLRNQTHAAADRRSRDDEANRKEIKKVDIDLSQTDTLETEVVKLAKTIA
jgi:hypothetical protein